MFLIYRITNTVNGKMYIGQTSQTLQRRFKGHCQKGYILHQAIQKYGPSSFALELLTVAHTGEVADALEKQFIEFYRRRNSLYNIEPGGHGQSSRSEETRRKISLARIGLKDSPETRYKKSLALRNNKNRQGIKSSEKTKRLCVERACKMQRNQYGQFSK